MKNNVLFILVYIYVTYCSGASIDYSWNLMPQADGTPSPRFDYAYGYNPTSKNFFVFGGEGVSGVMGDFYSFNTDTLKWSVLPSGPAARRDAGGAFCDNKFYLFSGRNSSTIYDDLWTFDEVTNTWNLLGTFTNMQLSAGTLACGGNIIYFGGVTPSGVFTNAVYTYAYNSWSPTGNFGPSGRVWTPFTFAPSPFNSFYLFGGYNGSSPYYDDFWFLTEPGYAWEQVPQNGQWPLARSGQILVYDNNQNILLFGGEDSAGNGMNDLWLYSLEQKTWELVVRETQPGGRLGAGAAVTDNNIFIFGGRTGWSPNDTLVNEMWVLTGAGRFLHVEILFAACFLLFATVFVL